MRAIGIELGVTESRISQIVTAAVGKLRQKFGIAILPRKKKSAARRGGGAARGGGVAPGGASAVRWLPRERPSGP